MVEKHDVEENTHDLRQGWFGIGRGFCLMLKAFTTDPNAEYPLRTKANDGTQRLLQTYAAVAEKCCATCRLEPNRLKDQRNRGGCANMVGGDLCRQRDSPAPVPHRVALHSLDEEVAFARVVVCRRNSNAYRCLRRIFSWIRLQSRCVLRKCCSGDASSKEWAFPPPSTAPKERSMIQVMELRAWASTSHR